MKELKPDKMCVYLFVCVGGGGGSLITMLSCPLGSRNLVP